MFSSAEIEANRLADIAEMTEQARQRRRRGLIADAQGEWQSFLDYVLRNELRESAKPGNLDHLFGRSSV